MAEDPHVTAARLRAEAEARRTATTDAATTIYDIPTDTEEDVPLTLAEQILQGAEDPFDWRTNIETTLLTELIDAGAVLGEGRTTMQQLFSDHFQELVGLIQQGYITSANDIQSSFQSRVTPDQWQRMLDSGHQSRDLMGEQYYTGTVQGFNELLDFARQFYASKWDALSGVLGQAPPGGGGGRGLTADDIRAQFDVDQLAAQVNSIWRANVLESASDPRGVARDYVEAIVAGQGKQKIDFTTFVQQRVEATDLFKSIFRNKPDSMSPEQYLQPYFQAALSAAGPAEAAKIARGGAQLGASSAGFGQRLRRTDAQTGSTPFLQGLERRFRALKGVLKG